MTEPVAALSGAQDTTSVSSARQPWDQQPGENDLWYIRFLRFAALGPKRSVSLVATGRRNAYPIPAHWPIQAKQRNWRERAKALDGAVKANPELADSFNLTLQTVLDTRTSAERLVTERELLVLTIAAGGYRPLPDDEDFEDDQRAVAS